jgi:hypothetical protein
MSVPTECGPTDVRNRTDVISITHLNTSSKFVLSLVIYRQRFGEFSEPARRYRPSSASRDTLWWSRGWSGRLGMGHRLTSETVN